MKIHHLIKYPIDDDIAIGDYNETSTLFWKNCKRLSVPYGFCSPT